MFEAQGIAHVVGAQGQAGEQYRIKLEARIENHIAKDVEAEGKQGFFLS